MKKIHIVLLVFIAAAIAILISFLQTTSTYDTVDTAMAKPGKFVHLMARLDKLTPEGVGAIFESAGFDRHTTGGSAAAWSTMFLERIAEVRHASCR